MKKFFPFAVFTILFLNSCLTHNSFDNSVLDDRYWLVFSKSINQIAFDYPSISSSGIYSDSEEAKFVYFSDMIDTISDQRLYFKHEMENQKIVASYVDSLEFENGMHEYSIEWDASGSGYIYGSIKYNKSGFKVSSEKYEIQYFTDSIPDDTTWFYDGPVCRILKKKKFNSRGELTETLEYIYFENGNYEIISTKE
jgi:hypothetical protein